jgi:hypothetical protein
MRYKFYKYFLWLTVCLFGVSLYSLNADLSAYSETMPEFAVFEPEDGDSIPPRFPVSKTTPTEYQDLLRRSPLDLRDPSNINTTIEYDIRTGSYIIRTRLGDKVLGIPMTLTPEEYQDYSMQESLRSYFRQRNEEEFRKHAEKEFNLIDMQFELGAAEKVFGPGGVRVRTQGSADVTMGLKRNSVDNPSLPERARSRTFFNFDESIQMNVNATVGTKVNFGMNYNTETSFDFDSKRLNLAYTGEEDEIIKSIEAGNVSMRTNNSLINGGASLFGMRTDLQFGKLRVNALLAQQQSQSKTVNSRGGVQTQPFEFKVDEYDENRHFFLSHFFRDNYDQFASTLPDIQSGILINRVEVWVTNKRNNYDQARNIVAFTDLAESRNIGNSQFTPSGSELPRNGANTLYSTVTSQYGNARNINQVTQTFNGFIDGGVDYEKIESARKLDPSEYTYNKYLGYISLRSQLQPDDVLAVAYEYTSGNQTFQVGEFATDNLENTSQSLYVKLLKGSAMSPNMPFWDLMMKNVYSLGAFAVQKDRFRLDVLYQNDTTGTYLNYLSEGDIKDMILLRAMNLDRLNSQNQAFPDGFFDYIEGYTIFPENGRVIFPVVEPFGSHLRKMINNDAIADKYVYQELYDSTLVVASQIAEKNKFILRGEYKASNAAEIDLGATNVQRGSVRVMAGGNLLTENVDYSVDYTSGRVTILNDGIISSGQSISVSLEDQSMFSMQRKTMMGLDLSYQVNKDFTIGGTIMHLSEMPLTMKTSFGDESIQNTLWGLNTSYKTESQWLTNVMDKLPLLTLTRPSQISFNAEFAHLIAGHYENSRTGNYSYLDDFESSQSGYSLLDPFPWTLSSVPYDDNASSALFPEASLVNNIDYGKNRALLAWYYIDGIFTRLNSSQMPSHIRQDREQLSNHFMRGVRVTELFPRRDQGSMDNMLQVLNLAYYPQERGPYNLDADRVNPDGTLQNPEQRFGGIMRKIDQSDFESANIEYIEFWILDPFIYDKNAPGGDLYFNLGDISEDILKDEKKFFENGLPIDGDLSKVDTTVWGKVPIMQSTVYAFDNTSGARALQDVGLNGLSSEEEKEYPAYKEFLERLQSRLSAETLTSMRGDPFSPFNDPAGDNFRYFRHPEYDAQETDILTRYKRYNGTEGNSAESGGERYTSASRTLPDVEDINQDNTLNENERYFQYKVSIRPHDMNVGSNYLVNKHVTSVLLANGEPADSVTWYQFKIPIRQYEKRVGTIRDFKTIRFMRMYMTDFRDETVLRFGKFELVRGDWRTYTQDLSTPGTLPSTDGTLVVSSVNIEENGNKEPVNYILPPGISRAQTLNEPQLQQQNEQALSMKVVDLASQDARAIYKNTNYDLRQYKRLQMFTHAEALGDTMVSNLTDLRDGELSVFIRLGSDYKNNYYEYEVPLKLTPRGRYSIDSSVDRETVWPTSNKLDFDFDILTELKLKRNRLRREGRENVSFQRVYSEYDPNNMLNKISVMGNPSLAEVKTIMIGVRNNSTDVKSGEIWVNELRLTDFNEDGGWAANANLNIALSDLGTVNFSGRMETAGFGRLDQSLNERRMDDYSQFGVATNVELGKFFPNRANVSVPLYYSYSREVNTPKYDPLDKDIELRESLDNVSSSAERDSILSMTQYVTTSKGIALNNVRVNIRSRNPMPYDPANFSFGYSYRENNLYNPETEYETMKDYNGNFAYNYTPYVRPLRPFDRVAATPKTRYLKQLNINYLPSNINFQTNMTRNYYELQLRDLANTSPSGQNNMPASFSQNWSWDRAFSLSWNLTNSLLMSFRSGTNARIEEPYMQVNRELAPDQYRVWQDSVRQSIAELGTPMRYDQTFVMNYTLPFQFIPALDWVSSSASYSASYNWDRVTAIDVESVIGNTIRNQRQIGLQGGFNLLSLYNKNKTLREINRKFTPASTQPTTARQRAEEQRPRQRPVTLDMEVTLSNDSATIVSHNMMTKKLYVTARGADGRLYAIKYKAINFGQISISNRDTVTLSLKLRPGLSPTGDFLNGTAEHLARFAMMIRRLNIEYRITDGMMLPGFKPEVGDVFGQKNYTAGLAPGIGFAFGSVDRSYISDVADKGWLVMDGNRINPALINKSANLNLRANLEPFSGLKVDLNANRVDTRNTEVRYMYAGMPETFGGNFTMTTITIGSAFSKLGNQSNGYASEVFERFRNNRDIITARLEEQYVNLGDNVNASGRGVVRRNSADVLIPAFLAAYTGGDANTVGITAFPSLKSLMPNWRVTYDGLARLPLIKERLKSITLSHQYRSSYSVGSFTSFLNWTDAGNGLGFIQNEQGERLPSSPYSISSVSITEGFTPLFGVDATLLNNMTVNAEYRKTRSLNLNISSFQLVESLSNEVVVGMGYRITEFNKVLDMRPAQDFSNDLNIRMAFSYRKMQSLIRKIEDGMTQPTSGNIAQTIQLSADYGMSRSLTLRAFYDLQLNRPLISSTAFPTSNSNYGVTVRFSLAQ